MECFDCDDKLWCVGTKSQPDEKTINVKLNIQKIEKHVPNIEIEECEEET